MMNLKSKFQRGFTLLELLVVLLITALLAGYVGPKLFGKIEQAKESAAASQMKTLADVLGQYRIDTGEYPTEEQGLEALIVQPAGENNWKGPYLNNEVPKDPWDHAYVWHNPARDANATHEVEILSLGADGQLGGSGKNKDITRGF
ncbi:type II secretion system major pseudopilin GspG [Glaciimonas immobilis]|uniref:Type II secretion system core protein G n=1 Tax=Glaciimonas immobilis TaxID=728004 RepID=A0A840RZT5_9BURK|nr:type II secretion system major pseudopilin GspG [Glaciimonas immobilis]MBB5201920.1 general secretion pathway protein G [Glaciimonas immobilis]